MKNKKLLSVLLATAMVFNMGMMTYGEDYDGPEEVVIEDSEDGTDTEELTEEAAGSDTEAVTESLSEDSLSEDSISSNETVDSEPVITQIPGTIRSFESYGSDYDYVTGFAYGGVNDRTEYVDTDKHVKVASGKEFLAAIKDAKDGKVKIIELTADIDLGYNVLALTDTEKSDYSFLSKYGNPSYNISMKTYTEYEGFTNPEMHESGVSKLSLSGIDGLTIFSKSGNSISHVETKLNSGANDIVIRNIHFKDMWQWDDDGTQKAVGWSNLKLNGGSNIWIDHCDFDVAFDGNTDLENGSTGISITWCRIGQEADEDIASDTAIYRSVSFMEELYQAGKLSSGSYKKYRDAGASVKEIMAYSAYHKKCHLVGSGDKDCVNYVNPNTGAVTKDANSNIKLTLAYNYYMNVGQRVPMIRQGTGHLYNCYIDDSTHQAVIDKDAFSSSGSDYKLSRCLNARNGACIAADTCVFEGIKEPITGCEIQGSDTGNMNGGWPVFFKYAYNRPLIVNSSITNSIGSYEGSSWDNDGSNLFTTGYTWKDKSTLGNWAWSSAIVDADSYVKSVLEKTSAADAVPFEFTYATDEELPYEYLVMPLDEVKSTVTSNAGCTSGKTSEEWCTAYGPISDVDYRYANRIVSAIDGIAKAELSAEYKAQLDSVRAKYDSAREAHKKLVTNLEVLEKAEADYDALVVEDMTAKIDAIGEVSYTDEVKERIKTARDTYDALSDEYKDRIGNLEVLEKAEADYAVLENISTAYNEGRASVEDTVTYVQPAKGKTLLVSENSALSENIITLAKGCKVQLQGIKKSYSYYTLTDKKLAAVNNNGVLTGKKPTGAEGVKIKYNKATEDGGVSENTIRVIVVDPALTSISGNMTIKKLKSTIKTGESFEMTFDLPLNASYQVTDKKAVVSDLSVEPARAAADSDKGCWSISGKAEKKGSASITFIVNNKKFKVNLAIKDKL